MKVVGCEGVDIYSVSCEKKIFILGVLVFYFWKINFFVCWLNLFILLFFMYCLYCFIDFILLF